jgi:hypothetical protein
MSNSLILLLAAFLDTGWTANVQVVPVEAPAQITAVPPGMTAAPLELQPVSLILSGLSNVTLLSQRLVPKVQAPAALTLPAPAIPGPAGIISAPLVSGAAPAASSISPHQANAGRTVLQRLAQDLPGQRPAAGDLQASQDFARRSFDFKYGADDHVAMAVEAVGWKDAETVAPRPLQTPRPKDIATSKPLPPPHEIDSSLPSMDAAIEMHASHSYPGRKGVDIEEMVAHGIDEYIAFSGMPNSEKHFILKYYEIGDNVPPPGHAPVVRAIERLAKAGIKVTIITDFNTAMTGVFPQDERSNTDFEHAAFKDEGPGRALKYLRETLGFKLHYGEGPLTLLSGVPLFNSQKSFESPLMHEKGFCATGPNGQAYKFSEYGTANLNATETATPGPLPDYGGRYNREMRSSDLAANQIVLNQAMVEIHAYDQRLSAKGLPESLNVPQRLNFKSGEFWEIAHTNGKQNLNVRKVDMLNRATQALADAKARKMQDHSARPDFVINEIDFSDFVLTYKPEVDALRNYLKALKDFYPDDFQKRLAIYGIFDQQFISPDGYGLAAALAGFLIQAPHGKSFFPFASEFRPMMKLFGYIRLLSGTSSVDPDGAPSGIHLWHDKTNIFKVQEKDPKTGKMNSWTYVFTGSFNNSAHFQSLERQDMYRLSPDSRLAKEFEDSIKKVVKAEPKNAVDLDQAVVAVWLGQFTHHLAQDDGMLGYAAKMIDALGKRNYALVESVFSEIMALPSKSTRTIAGEPIKERVTQLITFLNWYEAQSKQDRTIRPMTYRNAVNIGVGIMLQSPWGMRSALDLIYFDPKHSPDQTLALMKKAWKDGLKMDAPFPESQGRLGPASLN